MSKLFWKIFLSFASVMVLLIITNLAVTWVQAIRFENSESSSDHIAELAEEAVAAYQEGGIRGLKHWRGELWRGTELRIMLLDSQKRDVTGKPLPPHFNALLEGRFDDYYQYRRQGKYASDSPKRLFFKKFDRPIIWPVTTQQGHTYQFVVMNPHELSDHLYARDTVIWRVAISTLVVAAVALLLSLYLVKPIRILQEASRKLARGDLNSRVGTSIGKRRDELGELGHDFDAMADKIQSLLEGQQRMLRDVSHELRSPLARLRMALELSRKRSGESSELDRIELEAERINALIDDILQLVRLNNAQQPLQKTSMQLRTMLQQLAEDANLQQQRVQLNGIPEITLTADPKLLNRAVDNIIQNALKYSDGSVEITAQQDDQQVEIRIRDHGPGVDEEDISSLFTPFFRADQARSHDTGGYGLGLAIAAQAVQSHQGKISARNHAEGGLEVTISLPQAAS